MLQERADSDVPKFTRKQQQTRGENPTKLNCMGKRGRGKILKKRGKRQRKNPTLDPLPGLAEFEKTHGGKTGGELGGDVRRYRKERVFKRFL